MSRNPEGTINGISPPNRWTNRTDEPRNWSIPTTLCQLQARWLGKLDSKSRILVQQQAIQHHWILTILPQLWMSCQKANSELELSQLLFISVWQRELVRVLTLLVYLLIHNLLGLCANYPALPTKLCVTCLVTVTWLLMWPRHALCHISVTAFPTL